MGWNFAGEELFEKSSSPAPPLQKLLNCFDVAVFDIFGIK